MTTHSETCTSQRPGVAGHRPGRDAEDRLPHGGEAQRGGTGAARDVARLPHGQCELRQQRVLYGGHEPGSAEVGLAGLPGWMVLDGLMVWDLKKEDIPPNGGFMGIYMGIQLTNDNLANVQGYLWDDNSK